MVWETLSISVMQTRIKFSLFAIPNAQLDTLVLDQCAIKTAQQATPISLPSVINLRDTVVELALSNSVMAVRSGVSCGTLNARKVSMHLHAACASPNAQMVWLTLVLHATKRLSIEDWVIHFSADQIKTRNCSSATQNALVVLGVLDQFVGVIARMELHSAAHFALPKVNRAPIG